MLPNTTTSSSSDFFSSQIGSKNPSSNVNSNHIPLLQQSNQPNNQFGQLNQSNSSSSNQLNQQQQQQPTNTNQIWDSIGLTNKRIRGGDPFEHLVNNTNNLNTMNTSSAASPSLPPVPVFNVPTNNNMNMNPNSILFSSPPPAAAHMMRTESGMSNGSNNGMNANEQVDDLVVGMGDLNMKLIDKKKLADMVINHSRVQQDKDRVKQREQEEKEAKAITMTQYKKDTKEIEKIMISYAKKFNKPDLKVQPIPSEDTILALEYPNAKPSAVNAAYVTNVMKDCFLIEELPLKSIDDITSFVERLFDDEQKLKYGKKATKPVLKYMTKAQINPYDLVPMNVLYTHANNGK
ncbi:MAG: hypothetical protein Sylvanvirus2_22 [Sylvanvirus sp.]|uniref:Uncharacterized protein n=1 Tax=Sylvanvirus sp. TaxID=2487774 RepID=A0A3G5AHA0_9VIRU|nr:MAG: hypothetical protein Sylvanvirus2_22 [Sylvanvirus sp.]